MVWLGTASADAGMLPRAPQSATCGSRCASYSPRNGKLLRMALPWTTFGRLMTWATSPSTEHVTKSSALLRELERVSGQHAALKLALRDLGQHSDKVAGRLG